MNFLLQFPLHVQSIITTMDIHINLEKKCYLYDATFSLYFKLQVQSIISTLHSCLIEMFLKYSVSFLLYFQLEV